MSPAARPLRSVKVNPRAASALGASIATLSRSTRADSDVSSAQEPRLRAASKAGRTTEAAPALVGARARTPDSAKLERVAPPSDAPHKSASSAVIATRTTQQRRPPFEKNART